MPSAPLDDDRGSNLLTVYLPSPDHTMENASPSRRRMVGGFGGTGVVPLPKESGPKVRRQWMAIWLAPSGTDQSQPFYFSIASADGKVNCSAPFTLAEVTSRPNPEVLAGECP